MSCQSSVLSRCTSYHFNPITFLSCDAVSCPLISVQCPIRVSYDSFQYLVLSLSNPPVSCQCPRVSCLSSHLSPSVSPVQVCCLLQETHRWSWSVTSSLSPPRRAWDWRAAAMSPSLVRTFYIHMCREVTAVTYGGGSLYKLYNRILCLHLDVRCCVDKLWIRFTVLFIYLKFSRLVNFGYYKLLMTADNYAKRWHCLDCQCNVDCWHLWFWDDKN